MVVAAHTYAVFMRCIVGMEDEKERSREEVGFVECLLAPTNCLQSTNLAKHKIVPTSNKVSISTCHETFCYRLTNEMT